MAEKKQSKQKQTSADYGAEIRRLKQEGPERLYLIWGPEDYLGTSFLGTLKSICLPEGEDGFSYRRFNGPELDLNDLSAAIDSMPFMSERTFAELSGIDINSMSSSADKLTEILSNIPDWCTCAFVYDSVYEIDGRLKLNKFLKTKGREIYFGRQEQQKLFNWIRKRFAASGKTIGDEAIQRLIYVSGDLMNSLIPEIEKIAGYARTDTVTAQDVNAVASHIPEADTFDMIKHISNGQYDKALEIYSQLIKTKGNEPPALLAAMGYQLRRLYSAKIFRAEGKSVSDYMAAMDIKYEFIARENMSCASRFSLNTLARSVRKCADSEFMFKTSAADGYDLMKELLITIILGDGVEQA